jgi:hypothetical protein
MYEKDNDDFKIYILLNCIEMQDLHEFFQFKYLYIFFIILIC